MRNYLFRDKDKRPPIDYTIDCYDEVIDDKIDEDVFKYLAPILSKSNNINYDNPFFKAYQISVKRGLTNDEYKTISYLANWQKEKVKYNPKEIVRYLRFLGYTDIKEKDVFILVVDETIGNLDEDDCIILKDTVEVGKPLPKAMSFEDYIMTEELEKYKKIINKIRQVVDRTYIDGFDIAFGVGVMK